MPLPAHPIVSGKATSVGLYPSWRETSPADRNVGNREIEAGPRAPRSRNKAIDTDDGWSEPLPYGRQQWRETAIEQLLDTEDAEILFVAGCEDNQVKFHHRFDQIILLTAPVEVLLERLAARTSNTYGKTPDELRRDLDDVAVVEPLLRRVATHEVATTLPLHDVVTTVLRLTHTPSKAGPTEAM